MSSITIPKVHYIGINLGRVSADEIPFGFMTPGGTDSAAKKRIATVNKWCGKDQTLTRWIYTTDIEQFLKDHPNGVIKKDNPTTSGNVHASYTKIEGDDYKILDNIPNDPQTGFRITKSITRGGSWNGTSKWVRIEDPRGFELEISVDNLVKVMTMTTFVEGMIHEECVWGRQGANNILLPVNSEPYQDAVLATERKLSKAVMLKDIKIGDIIELKGDNVPVRKGVYCGLYREISMDNYGPRSKIDRTYRNMHGSKTKYTRGDPEPIFYVDKRYIIMARDSDGNDEFHGVSSLKVHKILGRSDSNITEKPIIEAKDYTGHGTRGTIVALSSTVIKAEDISASVAFIDSSVEYVESIGDRFRWNHRTFHFTESEFGQLILFETTDVNNKNKGLFIANMIEMDLSNNTWLSNIRVGENGGTTFDAIKNPDRYSVGLRVKDYKWKRMTIKVEDRVVTI